MKEKEKVLKAVQKYEADLRKLAKEIHDNPELGLHEFKACQWQTELLEKNGFTIEKPFCDIETAYKASYKSKKPGIKIAFLAEYDALPEIGHGCGHNLIATMSVGGGLVMRELADEFGGEVYVVGTPAEETAGTKVPMAKKGAFDDFDVVLMAHPGLANMESMKTMAINSRKIEFFGKTAHAAAAPQEGINALDAMINFFNLVNAMRQETKPDVRLHGIITDGGVAPNVIPDYTASTFYIRANLVADVQVLTERVERCAEGAALATGCTYKMTHVEEDFMDTKSNETLNELFMNNTAPFLDAPFIRTHGGYIAGSSDLGDVSYHCPAVQLVCKIDKTEGDPLDVHTTHLAECAGSDYGIDSALNFVKGMGITGVQLMTEPELMAKIKAEFNGGK